MSNFEYASMYNTNFWRVLRKAHLRKQPLCVLCKRRGHVAAATVVHHIRAHKGNWELFKDPNNLQSLCKRCHDSDMQSAERRGYSTRIGLDGWPIDDEHPFNRESGND